MVLAQLRGRLQGKVVIAGVGNPLRSDDGFGPHMIEQLRGQVKATLFDCGTVPENFLGPIRRQKPDTILVLDAADFSERPGEVRVFEASRWRGGGFSTHNFSLNLFADLLMADINASVYLVAVQPKSTRLGEAISPEVREGCRKLKGWLSTQLGHHT
jgi:hydrogenase 3 maturation protease